MHPNTKRRARPRAAALALAMLAMPVQATQIEALVRDVEGNTLANAVVVARALEARAAERDSGMADGSRPRASIAQVDKQFDPYVSVVRAGTAVEFPNRDDILHNVYSFSKAKTFQLPLYKDEPPAPVIFDRPGVVILGCNIHDWMVAYVYVADTPYFAKTAANGHVVLKDLPAGDYEVAAWHPRRSRRGSSEPQRVELAPGKSARTEFRIALKPQWRPRRPPRLD